MNKTSEKQEPNNKAIGVIFDMDGTLIDTAKATVPACQEIARQLNMPVARPEDIRKTIGWSELEFYRKLYPSQDSQLLKQYGALVEAYEARLIKELGAELVFPGIFDLLDYLASEGYFLAIASTGSVSHVDIVMRSTGLLKYFQTIKCNEPVKTAMVAHIIETQKISSWLMVGDKSKDAAAAAENGIESIGVQFGYGTEEELSLFTYIAESTQEILGYIRKAHR